MSSSSAVQQADPILVEVLRGDLAESRHRGAAAIVDAAGKDAVYRPAAALIG
jgi:L-asparaginase II